MGCPIQHKALHAYDFSQTFDRYLVADNDNNELLNHALSELVSDHIKYHYYTHGAFPTDVEVELEDFESKVCSFAGRQIVVMINNPFIVGT
jgi:hypothetical protein